MREGNEKGIDRGAVISLLDRTKSQWAAHLFPGIDPDTLGVRVGGNDGITAKLDTPHCHAFVAPADLWKEGWFVRFVDPILNPEKKS